MSWQTIGWSLNAPRQQTHQSVQTPRHGNKTERVMTDDMKIFYSP